MEDKPDLQLEIGHVLFVDVVGYSKLLIDDQRAVIELLNRIVRDTATVCAAAGTEKLLQLPTGDGMALVFLRDADAPVRCALEISRAAKDQPDLPLRMGVHSGPVSAVTDGNHRTNLAGAGLNIAQRVMDCGDAGHILLSKRVAEDLAQYRNWQPLLHDLGEAEVKHGLRVHIFNLYTADAGNSALPQKFGGGKRKLRSAFARPAAIFRTRRNFVIAAMASAVAALAVLGFLYGRGRSHLAPIRATSAEKTVTLADKSIAVLPFVDLSQARDQEYFCDGISEELLDALAKVPGLRVVARTSSFSFKGKDTGVAEIGDKLGVATVLEGSLRREGKRIRVTAQLINTRDGFHLWSDTFERELESVFAVQDEITRAIVEALKIKLAIVPAAQAPRNTEAHDLYLQGLYYSNKSTEEGLRKSLDFFQRSLAIDPNSARAWAGIAKTWDWLADAYVKPLDAFPAMRAAALKAIALDERIPEGHVYLGEAKRILDWDIAGAGLELRRALELDPNSSAAHFTLAFNEAIQGRPEESAAHMRAAVKADPLSTIISNFAALSLICFGRIDEAIAEAKRTLQLDPSYLYQTSVLATAYREKGMLTESIELFKKAQETTGVPQAGLAVAYAGMGRQAEARQLLDDLKKFAEQHYVPPEEIASVYVALDEKDEAFQWLDRACDAHSGPLHAIAFRPPFRPLYSDPRFAAILKRIGLDPAKIFAAYGKGMATASPKSIAVLPFENLSEEKANAYFADGIQDEILARLSKISELKVISRTSTQKYKSKPDNLRDIAQQLGVAHIVEGSVQRAGEQVRVTVQLINAATDSHLWAETYDRKLTDVFAVETEIAKTIAENLQAKITGSEQQAIATRPTENTEAHQLYLKGRYFWNKTTGDDFKKAIDYFNQAIKADPNYALAYTGLTDAYLQLPFFTAGTPQECYPKAKEAAQTALRLDDKLGDAHIAFAQVLQFYDFNYAQASVEFRRGLELNPNNAHGHWRYSWLFFALGRSDESFAEIRRALELDPLSLIINTDLGWFYAVTERYDEAIAQLRRTIEMEPNFYYAHGTLGEALVLQGKYREGLDEYKRCAELNDDPFNLALFAHAYATSGNKAQARKVLNEMREVAKQRYMQAYAFALVYAALGEKDEALRWLEQSYRDHAGADLAFIRIDPLLAPLRGDPRFEKLVRAVLGESEAARQ